MDTSRSAASPGGATTGGPGYRPEIDGLRAIAVLAVVLYHAAPAWLPGGFVGVDVFFVISGYLITRLLAGEWAATGRIDIGGFYARRIRRLMPALWVLLALLLLVAAVVLGPLGLPLRGIADSTLASLVYLANLWFGTHAGDYFAGPVDEMPLLHLWSLAVEEQFYLVYPLLLILLLGRGRRLTVAVLAGVSLLSLVLAEAWVALEPSLAFYQMPARFWELAAGGLVALGPVPGSPSPAMRRTAPWLAAVGTAVVLVACWTTSGSGHFPGLGALPAVAGATLLLLAVHTGAALGAAGRLLASSPLVAIGLMSYSLYLWHWPLLAIDRALRLDEGSVGWRLLLCTLALGAAALSLHLVERPARRMQLARGRLFVATAAITALLALAAVLLARSEPLPAERAALVSRTRDDAPANWRECHIPLRAEVTRLRLAECASRPGVAPRVAIWGDSHALAWQPFAWAVAEARGVAATSLTMNSCTPIPGHDGRRRDIAGFAANCERFNALALEWLATNDLDLVVLASRWPALYPSGDGDAPGGRPRTAGTMSPAQLAAGLDATLSRLAGVPRVLVMMPVPELRRDAPTCIARGQARACAWPRAEFERAAAPARRMLEALAARHPNVTLVDATDHFCDADRCHVLRDGHSLYWDDDHVSATAARAFAVRWLADPARYTPPPPH